MVNFHDIIEKLRAFQHDRQTHKKLLVLLIAVASLSVLLSSSNYIKSLPEDFKVSAVSKRTIKSPLDYRVADTEATETLKSEREKLVKRVFVIKDDTAEFTPSVIIEHLFKYFDEMLPQEPKAEGSFPNDAVHSKIEQRLNLVLTSSEWQLLLDRGNWQAIKEILFFTLEPIFEDGITNNKDFITIEMVSHGAVIRRQSNGLEQDISVLSSVYDEASAKKALQKSIMTTQLKQGLAFNTLVTKLASSIIRPNLFFDEMETAARIKKAKDSIRPVYHVVRKGQIIVRAGDEIRKDQELKIIRLNQLQSEQNYFFSTLGYAFLISLMLISVYVFIKRVWPNFQPRGRDLLLVTFFLIANIILIKVFRNLGEIASLSLSEADSAMFALIAPLACGGILFQVTMGSAALFLFILSLSLITGIFLESNWSFILYIIIGNLVGGFSVTDCSRRSDFLRAGLYIAVANVLIILCYFILYPQSSSGYIVASMVCAFLGGLFSALVATGISPLVEYYGSYITSIKLIELASLDRPLLRELSLHAPGTWSHSVVMSQLCESAAEAIGANRFLVRVGAYYHDIGKLRKPTYFIENLIDDDNKHEKLAPSMSALIIKSHVRDGVEMGRKVGLPLAVLDLIRQHHGTGLIRYFYDKAKHENKEEVEISEDHYRYLGPKPQTKEAAIVMLADNVEAASRTLVEPTAARIQGLVQKMINNIFSQGQLDECPLTLSDLHNIAKQFTRVLTAISHRRIEYSEKAEKINPHQHKHSEIGEAHEESDEQGQGGDSSKHRAAKHYGEADSKKGSAETSVKKGVTADRHETLRRLGM
ncbi:MAG: HDIG domain-containing protein [Deltaproteobacteria bacterium]|nr:HDIG domain-containing protein [Deltaproteobacteria bacterium]